MCSPRPVASFSNLKIWCFATHLPLINIIMCPKKPCRYQTANFRVQWSTMKHSGRYPLNNLNPTNPCNKPLQQRICDKCFQGVNILSPASQPNDSPMAWAAFSIRAADVTQLRWAFKGSIWRVEVGRHYEEGGEPDLMSTLARGALRNVEGVVKESSRVAATVFLSCFYTLMVVSLSRRNSHPENYMMIWMQSYYDDCIL